MVLRLICVYNVYRVCSVQSTAFICAFWGDFTDTLETTRHASPAPNNKIDWEVFFTLNNFIQFTTSQRSSSIIIYHKIVISCGFFSHLSEVLRVRFSLSLSLSVCSVCLRLFVHNWYDEYTNRITTNYNQLQTILFFLFQPKFSYRLSLDNCVNNFLFEASLYLISRTLLFGDKCK